MRLHYVAAPLLAALLQSSWALADYPVASHRYLADPAIFLHEGRLYLYCSNDDDNVKANTTEETQYLMASIVAVSTTDLKNWTDHGEVMRAPRDASWANFTWAPAVIERNGTFYMYFGNNGGSTGVASAENPLGPFTDARGSALINGSTPNVAGTNIWLFDPGVFIDDDDQAYLYFGGNGETNARAIALNEDMTSTSGSAAHITLPGFFEAAWTFKRNGIYYLTYSSNPANGLRIDYATSSSPMTGFTYKGVVAPQPPNNSNNNHASELEWDGVWYHAYHNRYVSGTAAEPTTFRRNIALEVMEFEENGDIVPVTYTRDGLAQLHSLNPYERVEGETFNEQSGVETEPSEAGGMALSNLESGDWVRLRGVDFGAEGAESFTASVASEGTGGSIELRLDAVDGTLVGTCEAAPSGGWQEWTETSCAVEGATGEHDLYLVFTGGDSFLFNVDHWMFTPIGGFPVDGSGGTGGPGAGASGNDGGGLGTGGNGSSVGEPNGSGGATGEADGGNGCSCRTAPASRESGRALLVLSALVAAWAVRRQAAKPRTL